jgi:thioredoxin-like negative regulator of GroEL
MTTIQLLDFTATYCQPCKALEPVLAALATEYGPRLQVVEINTEDDPIKAQQFGVRATPTLVLVRDGVEVGRVVGARNRAFIAGMLDRALAGDRAIASP